MRTSFRLWKSTGDVASSIFLPLSWTVGIPRKRYKFFTSSSNGKSGTWQGDRFSAITHDELRRLKRLEKEVDERPRDDSRQISLLRELNRVDPRKALARFEDSPSLSRNEDAVREYIKALVYLQRFDGIDLKRLLLDNDRELDVSRTSSSISNNSSSSTGLGGDGGNNNIQNNNQGVSKTSLQIDKINTPVEVVISESVKGLIWKSLRGLVAVVFTLSAASLYMDGITSTLRKASGNGNSKPITGITTRLEDIKGCDEVKKELQEIVTYLSDPTRFTRLGASLPKGVLLSGKPGTGKTLLARAIAGEAQVPFFSASGSDFEEMYVGVGARRIRDLFEAAREAAPCIVFIDEIDAVASSRKRNQSSSSRMSVNQLLVELDGFKKTEGVVVICATNFSDSLDPALTRAGRLDKTITVPLPDLKGRLEILQLYASKVQMAPGLDLDLISRIGEGMSGADLYNIINLAAVRAAADDRPDVTMEYLEDAFDRVMVGLERRNPMPSEERRLTAVHEGGHALVNILSSDDKRKLRKATILPRGPSLGLTWFVMDQESFSTSKAEYLAMLDTFMGGKAAEILFFGSDRVTSGCSSDLKTATQLARRMVMEMGLGSETVDAPMSMGEDEYRGLSGEAKNTVDTAVQRLLSDAYSRAYALLEKNQAELSLLADALVEFETLSGEEITLAIARKPGEIRRLRKEKEAAVRERSAKYYEMGGGNQQLPKQQPPPPKQADARGGRPPRPPKGTLPLRLPEPTPLPP